MNAAGEKDACGTAELRKTEADRPESQQRRGFAVGKEYGKNCGKTAEGLRKNTMSLSLHLRSTPPTLAAMPALAARSTPPLELNSWKAEKRGADLTPQPPPWTARVLHLAEPKQGAGATVHAGAAVLTHAAFDRPPVPCKRGRGNLKGAVSLAVVRRERQAAQFHEQWQAQRTMDEHDVLADALHRSATAGAAMADVAVDGLVVAALQSLASKLRQPGAVMESPHRVKEFIALKLAHRETEAFAVLFLDSQNAVIEFAVMFEGTLAHVSVYPREVARRALALNARAVILAHNHPSGLPEPSPADELLTRSLKSALGLVEVRVLDHLVVGGTRCVSFAERGML